MLGTFKLGMFLGFSLIISIGAQNLFVIQQAIRHEYTYLAALTCFICDAILILTGAAGLSTVFIELPILKIGVLFIGVVFLIKYGYNAILRSYVGYTIDNELNEIKNNTINIPSFSKIILLGLSFSLLNPAAILDTIIIIGGSANHYVNFQKYFFIAGTILASFIWFFSLATMSKYFSNRINNSQVWRTLDFISGALMWMIAISFARELLAVN